MIPRVERVEPLFSISCIENKKICICNKKILFMKEKLQNTRSTCSNHHNTVLQNYLSERIMQQGRYNMLSVEDIKLEALEKGFDELHEVLENHKREYAEFILTGQR